MGTVERYPTIYYNMVNMKENERNELKTKRKSGAGEMAQQLRAGMAFPEVRSSVPQQLPMPVTLAPKIIYL